MIPAERVLSEALSLGVRVYLKGERLAYRAASDVPAHLLSELGKHKTEIIDYLKEQERFRAQPRHAIPPIRMRQTRTRVPVSFAQQRLWFLDRLEGGSPEYHITGAMRVVGPLVPAAFARAVRTIVARHEALRTVFQDLDGDVFQVVLPETEVEIPVPEIDLRAVPARAQGRAVRRWLAAEAVRPFDLRRDAMLRAGVMTRGAEDHVLWFTLHHIASDGWSLGVLRRELETVYAAYVAGEENPLPPLRVQYADYAQWQRDWLRGDVLDQQVRYWQQQLAGVPLVHGLPLDRPRPPRPSIAGGGLSHEINGELVDRIRAFCVTRDVTLFMFLQTVFAVLISRYSHETDIVIGSPIAGRVHQSVEPLIGFFVNTLVIRTDLSGQPDFDTLLAANKQTILAAYAHQHVPFETLVEALRPERSLTHSPLFQILLTVQPPDPGTTRLGAARLEMVGGTGDRTSTSTGGMAKFELELTAAERGPALFLHWSYKTALFDADTIARLARHFVALIEAVVVDATMPVTALPLLSAAERAQVVETWNATGAPVGGAQCLHDLVASRAARQPSAVALIDGTRDVTYAELVAAADAIAARLQALGVGPESVVGICLERTWSLVATVLGVLTAGGAYLPLDPTHPPARLMQILTDSGAIAVVTQEALAPRLPWNATAAAAEPMWTGRTLIVEDLLSPNDAQAMPRPADLGPDNLAYVLFTSGSTGVPKGVAITHGSAVEMVHWAQRVFAPEDLAGVLAGTALSFDLSVFELFVPLAAGGTVILAPNALALPTLPARGQVRLLNTVPSAIAELVRSDALPAGVRTVNLAGEALSRALADQIWATGTIAALWNLYGPSEDTTYSTYASVARHDAQAPAIGRPIAATQAYVVDRRGQPVPIGVTGELWLGGAGLARGYLRRPALTASRFIPDPFSNRPGARLYRTGDLVRWRADGTLEYLGRLDHQVKVRGFRIELGEIEAALLTHPGVQATVVLAREDRPGDRRLVAYVVGGDVNVDIAPATLRAHLQSRLPDYMVPTAWVALDALPLTSHGKVDRRALPPPEALRSDESACVPPRDDLELKLVQLWESVLDVHPIGIRDSFFALGGHSLLAVRLVDRIAHQLGRQLPLIDLFQHSTIEALAERLRSLPAQSQHAALPPIRRQPAPRRMRMPVSFAQQRLWFLDRLEGSIQYHMPGAIRVRGPLVPAAFARAVRTIVARHEALRTVFQDVDGEVFQIILPDAEAEAETQAVVEVAVPEIDLQDVPPAAQTRAVRRWLAAEAIRPFDLSRDVLMRAGVLTLGAEDHVLWFTLHHIASDGWSLGVLQRELETLYAAYVVDAGAGVGVGVGAENPLPPLPVQYADYAQWQRDWLQGELLDQELAYWRQQLRDLPLVHGLPLDRPRPLEQSIAGRAFTQQLDPDLHDRIRAFCVARDVTLFMFLQTVFAVLISRYSHETDVVIGSPIAGRVHQDLEALIGFFVNTLVIRTDLSGQPDFDTLLAANKQTILAAYAHQHVPFEMLVEALRPERSLRHSPLFQILLTVQQPDPGGSRLGTARLEAVSGSDDRTSASTSTGGGGDRSNTAGTAKFELELTAAERGQALFLHWSYKTALFDADTIARLAGHFVVLLETVVGDAKMPVTALPLLPAAERVQLLQTWNATGAPVGGAQCLHDLVAARAARQPTAVALIDGTREVTYAELTALANTIATRLQALGVGPESVVGICLERTWPLVATVLGVLTAGGAYLPLDPTHPPTRLMQVLTDSGAMAVVTQATLASSLPWTEPAAAERMSWTGRTLIVEELLSPEGRADEAWAVRRPADLGPDSLAYVLFTSGSTGVPKGVAITHGSAVEMVHWARRVFAPEDLAGVLAGTALSFDLSVFEMFVPLAAGGTVILAPNALALPTLPARARVRLLNTVPSAIAELVRSDSLPATIRTVNLAGEPLPRALADQIWATGTITALWNLYGPSEDTTYSTYAAVTRDDVHAPAIGRPIAATQAYVVDRRGQPVPIGVTGELWLGGAGLARGYLRRPALTASRFIPDPFSNRPGARLYRTGDLVRWRADGTLEYLGRLDHQVKIRGFRIELGEIEAALLTHPAVQAAVVLAREDQPGDRRLVAYVVGGANAANAATLRAHLQSRLPDYMIPTAWVPLDALPLTSHGKIDRRALPAPEALRSDESACVPPRDELEQELVRLWESVLDVSPIGIRDSFFGLGGHSLLAVRLVDRIARQLGRALPLIELFQHSTIEALAERLRSLPAQSPQHAALPPIRRQPADRRTRMPVSFAQQRLWFLDRLEGGSVQYHMPGAIRVRGPMVPAAFARAVRTIVARHEALRTVFQEAGGDVFQVVLPEGEVEIPILEIDLQGLSAAMHQREVRRWLAAEAVRPFDLSRDVLLRAGIVTLGAEDHVVWFTLHHIASDGWSLGVLQRELQALYAAYATGGEDPLPPPRVQYADYAQWQRDWLQGELLDQELAYWRQQLRDLPLVHALPLDRPRPPEQGFAGAMFRQQLDRDLRDRIRAFCVARDVTLFMFLQTVFAVLVSRYSHETDIVIGSPIAGRVHQDLEALIGFFVNTLVIRTDLSGQPDFDTLLAANKQTILAAYAHQHVPFEMLVEALRPERSLTHSPLFQLLLTVQPPAAGDARLGEAIVAPVSDDATVPGISDAGSLIDATVRFDLELAAVERPEQLDVSWAYRTALFDAATITRMAAHFVALIEAVVSGAKMPVTALPLLSATERAQVVETWNATGRPVGGAECLHDLVAARAARQPTAVALIDGTREVTYAELLVAANAIAAQLQALGVVPECVVGICLERTWSLVATVLGVLTAGGAYLPLDPTHPPTRLMQVLTDSGALAVVTQEALASSLPWNAPAAAERTSWAGRTLIIEDLLSLDGRADDARSVRRPADLRPDNLAYVLFTSGSTGVPKGVAITHGSAVEMVRWAHQVFAPEDLAGVLAGTALSFDLSVFELFVPLAAGGTVILAPNALALPTLPARAHVRLLNTVPSAIAELVRSEALPATIRTVNLAGEPLPRALADQIWATGTINALWNLYGPSEDTTYSTYAFVARDDAQAQAPAIGRPITATQAYVVDRRGQPVPIGVTGELWLGGAGLARGYLRRPALTASRFIPDPFSGRPGARLYRTGDLVRWRADGTLEYLGRLDHQVKVRGFRIELGEIEAALLTHPGIQATVVLAREDRPGDKRLVAYIVGDVAPDTLRAHLQARLPDYMIPTAWVALDALPLTSHGKIDRRALPAPESLQLDANKATRVLPRDAVELRLARIWERVLGVERAGMQDDFFERGGHSLLAVQLMSQVVQEFDVVLPLATLFRASTIESLATLLRDGPSRPWSPLVPIKPEGTLTPLFCVHPIGGDVLCYHEMAQALGHDRPVYGLATGHDGRRAPLEDVVEMGTRYLAAIREIRSRGPYLLCGWSFGGLVAFEIARQLENDGEEVTLLALLDSVVPGHVAYQFAGPEAEFAEEMPAAVVKALSDVYNANARAGMNYRPLASPRRAVLVQATAKGVEAAQERADDWRRMFGSSLEVLYIPGTHHSILKAPHVETLAAMLNARFDGSVSSVTEPSAQSVSGVRR